MQVQDANGPSNKSAQNLYLDLLKKCLLNTIYQDAPAPSFVIGGQRIRYEQYSDDVRLSGHDWPSTAHTMIGLKRLNNIQDLTEKVIRAGVKGDLIEAGVWRGGSTIFMRGILQAYDIRDRKVWVADSFCGFPSREETSTRSYTSPAIEVIGQLVAEKDPSFQLITQGTRLEDVKKNFERYGLLDGQVQFIKGFFKDTLPAAPIEKLAILRADGDLYDSTYQILENLYPRVSPGGYVIIDDYHSFLECRQAVHDYLDVNGIHVDLVQVDSDAVFWQRND